MISLHYHRKELNVAGSHRVTDDGIALLLINGTKSGALPRETAVGGKQNIRKYVNWVYLHIIGYVYSI